MQRTSRLCLRALTTVLVVLACTAPARADEQPPAPIDPWAGLTYAVRARAAAEQHWYAAVAQQHESASRPRSTPAPRRVEPSGDVFDALAACESGGDPTTNTGNGFGGAFQFTASSWRTAWERGGFGERYPLEDGSPTPARTPWSWPYAVQKSVAMYWAGVTNPASQWPVCWPRSA